MKIQKKTTSQKTSTIDKLCVGQFFAIDKLYLDVNSERIWQKNTNASVDGLGLLITVIMYDTNEIRPLTVTLPINLEVTPVNAELTITYE